jgi:hypothetical protein
VGRRPKKPVTTATPRFRFDLREIGGACGDLGTLLPLALGAIAVAGLAPGPILIVVPPSSFVVI